MKTAKVFKHGNSQAVRLPKEFRLPGDRVRLEMTPYDLMKGRIVYRFPPQSQQGPVPAADIASPPATPLAA